MEFFLWGKLVDLFNRGEVLNDFEYYVLIDIVDRFFVCVSRLYYFDFIKVKEIEERIIICGCFFVFWGLRLCFYFNDIVNINNMILMIFIF